MLRNNADARRCSYFELGLPVMYLILDCEKQEHKIVQTRNYIL